MHIITLLITREARRERGTAYYQVTFRWRIDICVCLASTNTTQAEARKGGRKGGRKEGREEGREADTVHFLVGGDVVYLQVWRRCKIGGNSRDSNTWREIMLNVNDK